jgi:hypothetical protein
MTVLPVDKGGTYFKAVWKPITLGLLMRDREMKGPARMFTCPLRGGYPSQYLFALISLIQQFKQHKFCQDNLLMVLMC